MRFTLALSVITLATSAAAANPPVASYIFPAGGQRGTTVPVRVGGLFLHESCGFELLGPGVRGPARLRRTHTAWFEGPILPLPDSQRQEDYPKDMAGEIVIDPSAAPGVRHWRLWTSQGATPAMKFVVGELPELVESEVDGDPIPVPVKLPVTVNGRVFPRQDVDVWTFRAKKGEPITCQVHAARIGSPLDARLDLVGPDGRRLTESGGSSADPRLTFTAPAEGDYQVRIHDSGFQGGQAYVYRLTLTTGPSVESVYPLGGRRGETVRLSLAGHGLKTGSAEVTIPKDAGGEHPARVDGGTVFLDVDGLSETTEEQGTKASLPAMLNGRIAAPGEVDAWTWTARKGDVVEFELRAARLGSRLDGVLTVLDAAGKSLARAESSGPNQPDATLRFTAPADGPYVVQVQDRFRTRGGPGFAYRLRAAPPPALDLRLTLAADALAVPRGGSAKLKVNAERVGGFKDAIKLQVQGLPDGVSVADASIAAGQNAAELTFKASDNGPVRTAHVTVHGSALVEKVERKHRATLPVTRGEPVVADLLLAVALPTPFVIKGEYDMGFAPRGSVHKRKYKVERNGYDGPIEVSLTDRQARHLQGVTGPTITVPAGATEFTYSALLPPWMETGRTCRVCVMGVATVKEPDGSEHRVSFSSINQNEQLVAVVGPGEVALDLATSSVKARPGATVELPLSIKRGQGLAGPLTVELVAPPHVRGVTAGPCVIAADQTAGKLVLRFAAATGPFNMPLTVRATLWHNGEPRVAEAKVEIDR